MGVVTVLYDCLKKTFMLKTSLLGTYGKIATWAVKVNPVAGLQEVFPEEKGCFTGRQTQLFQSLSL